MVVLLPLPEWRWIALGLGGEGGGGHRIFCLYFASTSKSNTGGRRLLSDGGSGVEGVVLEMNAAGGWGVCLGLGGQLLFVVF